MITVSGWYYLPDSQLRPDGISSCHWIARQEANFSASAAQSLLFPPLKCYLVSILPSALQWALGCNMGMGRDNIQQLNRKAGAKCCSKERRVFNRGVMCYSRYSKVIVMIRLQRMKSKLRKLFSNFIKPITYWLLIRYMISTIFYLHKNKSTSENRMQCEKRKLPL